jgi:hypothetical protein
MTLLLSVPGAAVYVLMSGAPVSLVIKPLLPTSFAYWVDPDGGAPATVALLLIGATLLWGAGGAVFGALVGGGDREASDAVQDSGSQDKERRPTGR